MTPPTGTNLSLLYLGYPLRIVNIWFLIQVLYHIAMYPFAIAAFLPRLTLISSAINITMSRESLLVTTCYFQKSAREAAQRMASHGWGVSQQVESSDASCWCLSFNTHSWESPSDYSFKCGCQWRWFIVASTRCIFLKIGDYILEQNDSKFKYLVIVHFSYFTKFLTHPTGTTMYIYTGPHSYQDHHLFSNYHILLQSSDWNPLCCT